MGERRNLMLGLVAVALVLLLGAFFLLTRGGGEEVAEPLPAPSLAAPAAEDPAEDGVEVETGVDATTRRGSVVMGTSNRDPFAPVIEPTPESTADESSDAKTRSSSDAGDDSAKKSQSPDAKATSRNETKADAETKKEKEKVAKEDQDSGGKAPKPVGGSTVEDETERAGTDVRVVDVRESIAVVRVNDGRTTLYVGVPDASGVTFTSSLSGTCGLFSIAGSEELLTICEGETRRL